MSAPERRPEVVVVTPPADPAVPAPAQPAELTRAARLLAIPLVPFVLAYDGLRALVLHGIPAVAKGLRRAVVRVATGSWHLLGSAAGTLLDACTAALRALGRGAERVARGLRDGFRQVVRAAGTAC